MSAGSVFVYDDMGSNNQQVYIDNSSATDQKQLLRVFNTSTSSCASGRNNSIFAETGVYTGSGGSWALGRSSGAILGYDNSTAGTYSYGVAGYHYGNTALANDPHAGVFGGSNFVSTTNVPLTYGALGYQASDVAAYGAYGANTWSGVNAYGGYFSATGAATTNYGVYATASGAGTNWAAYFVGNGYLGTAAWTYLCDRRLKENIVDLDKGLKDILKLKPVRFDYIVGEKNQLGFIAQDVKEVLPELVITKSDGYLGLKTDEIIPVLVNAIKEQQQQIEDLKIKMESLMKSDSNNSSQTSAQAKK